MTISIIIAVKTWQKNLEECVGKCLKLDYPDFEIIILPDEPVSAGFFKTGKVPVVVCATGPVRPALKRDMAIDLARGEILAFIDDDAYPDKNWLNYAVENFQDADVAAVGGPAVTPPADSLRQKAGGAVYSSILVSGHYVYRYIPVEKTIRRRAGLNPPYVSEALESRIEVEDYPSCNLLVRKSIMQELGGFDTAFWPGEDTKLCLDIAHKLKKKIIYDPRALVWHHRRRLFAPHLRQIAAYALHRGYFVKHYPETSLKSAYFIPSIFLLGLASGAALSIISMVFRMVYLYGLSAYLAIVFIFSIFSGLRLLPLVFCGIIATHLTYGFYFLIGLFIRRLKE